MSLTNLNKSFSTDDNFWVNNSQLTIMSPFSYLYKRDKSKDKTKSSKEMYCVIFMCEPDPEVNKFFRIPRKERIKILQEEYLSSFDVEDEAIMDCLVQYPVLCMSAVERALKEEVETMQQRAEMFRDTEYTLDKTEFDSGGKSFLMKGTATQLDNLRSKTPKIYENYEKLEAKFLKTKEDARLYGGRKKSKSENKLA